MKVGEEFMIANDPQSSNQDDWVVILKDPWDKVVGRYHDIEITEKGTRLSYRFEPVYVPEGTDIEGPGFLDHISEVLGTIIKEHHEKDAMMYYSKETGERVDV
jgi:hypothetical protein